MKTTMARTLMVGVVCAVFMVATSFALDRSPSAEGTELYFISPQNGETISGPVTVVFGLNGMGVAPAGVEKENTGHHHLLINTDLPALDLPVPADDNHKHFGAGQTQTTIELPPGKHTLQLLLGNHLHIPHDPVVASDVIEITVE
jgi:hypothetical protein